MPKVYLGLGTNLGNKPDNLTQAIKLINEKIGKVISQSSFYETAPWGFTSDNDFLNAAAEVETSYSPHILRPIDRHRPTDVRQLHSQDA